MKLAIPFLEDLPDVANKRVLVRTDYNVPIIEESDGTRRAGDTIFASQRRLRRCAGSSIAVRR